MTPKNSPIFLYAVFLFFSFSSPFSRESVPDEPKAEILEVRLDDFAFDGGSLLFELQLEGSKQFLLAVHPNSGMRRTKSGVFLPDEDLFLLSSNRKFSESTICVVRSNTAQKLSSRLNSPDDKMSAALRQALEGGLRISIWGGLAMENQDIEKLFEKRAE